MQDRIHAVQFYLIEFLNIFCFHLLSTLFPEDWPHHPPSDIYATIRYSTIHSSIILSIFYSLLPMLPFSHHHAPELYARLISSLLPMSPTPHHHAPELYARLYLFASANASDSTSSRTDQALVEGKQRFVDFVYIIVSAPNEKWLPGF